MRKNLIVLISAALFAGFTVKAQTSAFTELEKPGLVDLTSETEIILHTDKALHRVNPSFWGTNFLYWIDDDASLANGKIVSHLNRANIKLLRYPGGTIADNFHWKSSTLDNINMFPYESGAAETDFDEFMAACRKIGAEPSCVLNTETWFVKKDIAGGAHEAANWLRYCRSKGYKVKYWEIGNETYWHPIMSAEEYADLVNVYADTLKRIDPSVILGINGHWSVDFVGTKERIKTGSYAQMMHLRSNINSREDHRKYEEFVKANTILPVTTGDAKWWRTLAERCGNNADMIIVHWYFSPNQLPMVTERLMEVRGLFSAMYPDKSFLLNMSEFNVTERSASSHLELTEMIGAMLKAKTDISSLWPMRMKYKKPTLLDYETDQPSIIYQIYRKLSADLTGSLIKTSSSGPVPCYASASKTSSTVVMTGSRIDKPASVSVKLRGSKSGYSSCSVWRISGGEFDYRVKEETAAVKQGAIRVNLQPSEVMVLVFK